MSALQASAAVIAALALLLLAAWVRSRSAFLAKYFVPASLVAGGLGLAAGPQVTGALAELVAPGSAIAGEGIVPSPVRQVWSTLPGLLINLVFAGLFLGTAIPGPRAIWRLAGAQVAFGQTMAWGQYVVGIGLTLAVLTPLFELPPIAGALIEIGFEGGHGTAAGMAPVFSAFGFADGLDMALGLATVGVVGAVVIGMVLVNWGARRGIIAPGPPELVETEDVSPAIGGADIAAEGAHGREARGRLMPGPEIIEPLTLVAAFLGAAILIGWAMLEGLRSLEVMVLGPDGAALFQFVPLFPFAMLGGLVVQIILDRMGKGEILDRRLVVAVQGLALDLLIATAIATLSLTAIGRHIWAFILLAVAGTAWCVFCFFVLAPRYMHKWWFERAVADFGQSMGMTASGLLLLRVADPLGKSPVLVSFGYKQLLFEPIVGGGLFTAAAIPLIVGLGAPAVLVITTAIMAAWMAIGLFYFGKMRD